MADAEGLEPSVNSFGDYSFTLKLRNQLAQKSVQKPLFELNFMPL